MKLIDMAGRRFGVLVVVGRVGRSPANKTLWRVNCDCGVSKTVAGEWLRNGRVVACGPTCPAKTRTSAWHRCVTDVYAGYRRRATDAQRAFTLSRAEAEALMRRPCAYCGAPPSNRHKAQRYSGIDRVNNALGYGVQNCVPCCKLCNLMKQNHTVDAWLSHIRKIAAFLA